MPAGSRQRAWRPRLMVGAAMIVIVGMAPAAIGGRRDGPVEDRGASGTWQALLKLQTTASVLHLSAHPDEEPGGVLAYLSRHDGVRVASLTLTRGEGGANALGTEAFDALGLLRTEELTSSNQYYGVDEQYFTRFADFGFAKRADESFERWGRKPLLEDVVRVIRMCRPFAIVSRFHGTARDGHGSSSAASLVMRDAVRAAADPAAFPEQLRDGLRPWRVLEVYSGGLRLDEPWTVRVDPGQFSPWLGHSYADMGRLGLRLQRSSVSDRNDARDDLVAGPAPSYYVRLEPAASGSLKEASFLNGIDATLPGVYQQLLRPTPAGAVPLLQAIQASAQLALSRFSMRDPSLVVAALAHGLSATRDALTRTVDPDVRFVLAIKERQFQHAINTALALDVSAIARPLATREPSAPIHGAELSSGLFAAGGSVDLPDSTRPFSLTQGSTPMSRMVATKKPWFPITAAAVLAAATQSVGSAQDRAGAGAVWQKLLALQTTASVMHTTAHPDDEHGGALALLSRRDGARVSLLTLNRGESGDNAIGPQLFDGLGLIRTEELNVADRYYGVDTQYFTTVIDYGFSKRLEEAFDKWGREDVLRDVVRIIRMERPLVLMSRFQGNERDGHGNHQTAGVITQLAFKAAGDPSQFPEQLKEGLRPWQPLKLYIGGVRENEAWHVRVDPGEFSPWIGDSYASFARLGLSYQRSQTGGRFTPQAGSAPGFYRRVASIVAARDKERSFFDGIDTSLAGLFSAMRTRESPGAVDLLKGIDAAVRDAVARFSMRDPSAVVPALTKGLTLVRDAHGQLGDSDPDVRAELRVKERQFHDAINTALAVDLTALAQPAGLAEPTGPFAEFAPPALMAAPVPGQTFEVVARVTNRGTPTITPLDLQLETERGWKVASAAGPLSALATNQSAGRRFTVGLSEDVPISSRPYFRRDSIQDTRYALLDPAQFGRPASAPPAVAVFRYTVEGVAVDKRQVVQRRESKLPYGDALRELRVVPALSVRVSPEHAVVPLGGATKQIVVTVDLMNNRDGEAAGTLTLRLPATWRSEPASQPFAFSRAGERATHRFTVAAASLEDRQYQIEAVATVRDRRYTEGHEIIDHRDLEVRYLYRPSVVQVRGLDVQVVPNLNVGYVMGVGDQVPAGIAQLGSRVTLLDEAALATGHLAAFDAIVTGTRAYAVRDDLRTYNQRLLDYVRNGGNLVVLYNTQELVPERFAPFPGEHGPRAEEVSEEDSPVRILAPAAQAFTWPNRITPDDFTGWVEQRGSKFWAGWDAAYTPMLETFDKGQPPQRGGWLQARPGKGVYTYLAYAFHRQLPYGVPGAYRLLANLLALGKSPPAK